MALSDSFDRPKLNTTLTETLTLNAAIAEDDTNNRWIVDITQTVGLNQKTVFRVYIPYTVSGTSLSIEPTTYVFPGNAANYSAGGSTPAISAGALGKKVDLDNFHTLAGDARVNS
jgi:hypothetical protein